ncbi:MAG TPA: hypothetical protein VMF69_09865 [Gemmataceae bacterium]|nr:hypothetical protein [Gemmataceae bacterium]
MKWHLHNLGFLPSSDPIAHLQEPRFERVEQLAADLPELIHKRTVRGEMLRRLSSHDSSVKELKGMEDGDVERLFLLYSYFASAYIHAPGLPPEGRLPSCIAAPLVNLARHVDRPPILAYCSYCLHNWRRVDQNGPVALDNLKLLQNFGSPGNGKEDEDWFILVHVDIEARAGSAIQAVDSAQLAIRNDDVSAMESLLEKTADSLMQVNKTLARMPEGCRPEVYFAKVRPYIFGFTGVIYEDCFSNTPQTYRGETGAQSSIIPALLAFLGIRHKNSLLTDHLTDMRNYMPTAHGDFIRNQVSVRDFVQKNASVKDSSGEKRRIGMLYNDCINELLKFRTRHFDYAVNYIERRVNNPIATGGTPYVPWLKHLIEETKEYFIA